MQQYNALSESMATPFWPVRLPGCGIRHFDRSACPEEHLPTSEQDSMTKVPDDAESGDSRSVAEAADTCVVCIYPANGNYWDGIAAYSHRLTEELRKYGADARIERPSRIIGAVRMLLSKRDAHQTLLLQYNPFAWGRWGFSPWLPVTLRLARLIRRNVRIGIMVHEPYVVRTDLRSYLMGSWQRMQLRYVLRVSHVSFASTERFSQELHAYWPRRSVFHLPVGSNLPDERTARTHERVQRGIDDHIVLAGMSAGHDSYVRQFVADAVRAIVASTCRPVALLLLGANNPPPTGLDGLAYIDSPGYLDDHRLARALAASDIFLAPYVDGASTRRTALMAALQHALPIVTTVGPRTDRLFDSTDAVIKVVVGDSTAYARTATVLATNPSEQTRLRVKARDLYERAFDWPVVADRLMLLLARDSGSPTASDG